MKKLLIILIFAFGLISCDNTKIENEIEKGKFEHNYKTYYLKWNLTDGYIAIRENSSKGKIVDQLKVSKLFTRAEQDNFIYEFKKKNK